MNEFGIWYLFLLNERDATFNFKNHTKNLDLCFNSPACSSKSYICCKNTFHANQTIKGFNSEH